MVPTARPDDRGHAALALLLAGLAVAGFALGARTARAEGGSPGTHAPHDTTALLAQAAESGTSSPSLQNRPAPPAGPDGTQALEPGSGFTLRRVANPRYRAPSVISALIARPLGTLVGSEFARARLTYRESGPVARSTDWEVVAGREQGARSRFELWASGLSSTGYDQLRTLRLTSIQGPTEWSLGDVAAQPIGSLSWIQRLRGVQVTRALRHGSDWRVLGGVVPTLTHGVTPNTALASFLVDQLPVENGTFSFGLMGFGRRAPLAGRGGFTDLDSLPGGGGAALYAMRLASRYGDVGATYMMQAHDLDGRAAAAGIQALEWTLSRPAVIASVRDQVGTRNARQPGTERLSPAPSHEGRMSAQVRMLQGRAEMHLAGLTSSGSDVAISAQTAQAGVSGNLGSSGWYSGLDFSWNRRAPLFADERRFWLQTGRVSDRGSVVLMRIERNDDNLGRDQVQFTGEASASPMPGLRLSLEPRLEWQAGRFERSLFSARMGWPLLRTGARMNASMALASARTQGFRKELSEATVSITFAPRSHDRATFEARRYEENGVRSLEATGSYDLLTSLYSNPADALNANRTGVLTVTVVRADSASGVPDALISLDGKEFRFTDGEGIARFSNVPAGSHVVSVVERSLPTAQRVVGAATAFVTIERGRTPAPVSFEIARPVRKVRF